MVPDYQGNFATLEKNAGADIGPDGVRLLEAAFEELGLRLPRATLLVDYHVRRNAVARISHAKTWQVKHRGVKFLRL